MISNISNNLSKNEKILRKPIRFLLIFLGTFFIGIGIIGILVPILPTTPFLLISAALYARSSKKFYSWLINNKIFGGFIKNYREGKGTPLKFKIITIVLLWITISCTVIFAIDIFWARAILVIIASGVTIYIIRIRPTDKRKINL